MKFAFTSIFIFSSMVFAQSVHFMQTFTPHCLPDDDEVYPTWNSELITRPQEELKDIIKSEFSGDISYNALLECSEKSKSAPEEIQKYVEKKYALLKDGDAWLSSYNPCDLTMAERLAILRYTGHYYGLLNRVLRNKDRNLNDCMENSAYINVLNGALTKIKPYVGFVRRSVELPKEVLKLYQPGHIVRERSFLSTSTKTVFPNYSVRIIIKTKNCVNIAPYSDNPNEKEVLCPSNSVFQILARIDQERVPYNNGPTTIILMEQIK